MQVLAGLGLGAALLVAGCGGGSVAAVPPATQGSFPHAGAEPAGEAGRTVVSGAPSFEDTMEFADAARWQASRWNNGGHFLNGWHPEQLAFHDGRLLITLEADTQSRSGMSCVSGEYRSLQRHGHGFYEARLMASGTPGTVTAFFLYTGPAEGTRHDEIDVEIKGDDPTRLHLNYWSDGVEHPSVVPLGFDASAAFHDYAFRWTATGIQWFVDGRLVHEESGARGPLPHLPGYLMLSLWGATGTGAWSSDYQVTDRPSQAAVERVRFEAEAAPAERLRLQAGLR
ncbi:family 16 glycosylhydrolase [Caldimonas tepidiphila]|uniref:family 16 glycosylhydrolase n=1 Tax=Caldimonas tepidiphila TaxID=2315841 RepID=UPI0013006A42|nr:family 16 glycosylhydrolase [Caldimonas tepidiphila]